MDTTMRDTMGSVRGPGRYFKQESDMDKAKMISDGNTKDILGAAAGLSAWRPAKIP